MEGNEVEGGEGAGTGERGGGMEGGRRKKKAGDRNEGGHIYKGWWGR